ncbi:MAG TPA: C40 family peptidase [Steroidobacteraceae bacterium]|nr:C40 family peptidase [Steroidobacteraceae bacterium]
MKLSQLASLVLILAIAGCSSTPAPRSESPAVVVPPITADIPPVPNVRDDEDWDGGGGSATTRKRGDAIVSVAMSMRGAKYRFGGATPEGFDCSGLVFYVHRQLGLKVPRTSRDQADAAETVKVRKLRRGDLVFFRIGGSSVNHVGIYIGKRRFVHAPGAGKAVTVNSLDDEFYADAFSSAGRFWNRLPE